MPFATRLTVILALLAVTGCSVGQGFSLRPYRMNIQQGNYLEAKDVDQVKVGMTQSQVRFLIGTPMIADPFNAERWDYVFYFKVGRTREEIMNRMTIWFEDQRVVRIERPDELDDQSRVGEFGFDG